MAIGCEIVFLSRTGRLKMVEDWKNGKIPNDFLYGFSEIIDSGVRWRIQEMEHPGGLRQKIDDQFKRIGQFLFRQNLPLLTILNSVWKDRGRSVIYFTNIDSIAISYCILKAMGLVSAPIIHVSQGLTNEFERRTIVPNPKWFSSTLTFLLRHIDVLTALGRGAVEALQTHFTLRGKKVHYLPFGIDLAFWSVSKSTTHDSGQAYLLSVGSDEQRDFDTLINAGLSRPVRIVTRLPLPDLPAGYTLFHAGSFVEIKELYRNAVLTLVPVKDVSQPSGQSSALQSMASGCPVVISDFRGIWDPELLQDYENVLYAKVGSPCSLHQKVSEILSNPTLRQHLSENGLRLVKEHYGSDKMGKRLLRFVEHTEQQLCEFV